MFINDIVDYVLMQGIIDQVQKQKLLFIETQDAAETTLALINFQKVRTIFYSTYILGNNRAPKIVPMLSMDLIWLCKQLLSDKFW